MIFEMIYFGYVIPFTVTALVVLWMLVFDKLITKTFTDESDPFYKWFVVVTVVVYPLFWIMLVKEMWRMYKDKNKP